MKNTKIKYILRKKCLESSPLKFCQTEAKLRKLKNINRISFLSPLMALNMQINAHISNFVTINLAINLNQHILLDKRNLKLFISKITLSPT